MTVDERNNIVAALHALELRVTERLVKLEGIVEGHHDLKNRVSTLEVQCEAERLSSRRDSARLLLAIIIIGLVALGNGVLRVIPMF